MVVLHCALSAQHCKHDSSVQSDELDGKLSWKPGFGLNKTVLFQAISCSRARSVDVGLRGQTCMYSAVPGKTNLWSLLVPARRGVRVCLF